MSNFLKEVEEQPQSLQRLIDNISSIKKELTKIRLKFPKIAFFGMGSSLYAGISASYLLRSYGMDANFFDASEVEQYVGKDWFGNFDICVFISYSGETSEVKAVFNEIKNLDILRIGITANGESFVAKNSDLLIETYAGEEKSIGATKSYANSVLAAFILGLVMANRLEEEIGNLHAVPNEMIKSISGAHYGTERILNDENEIEFDNTVITSTGFAMSTVYQSVLTLNAIASVNAFPVSAGMLRHHGPEELFLKKHGLIEFIPNSASAKVLLELYEMLSKMSRFSWIISSDSIEIFSHHRSTFVDRIDSKIPEYLQTLLFLPYVQILSHKITTLEEEKN